LRAPCPILLLILSSMVMVVGSGALASHPLTAYLVAGKDQVTPDPADPSVTPTAAPQPPVDDLEAQMLSLLNDERETAGLAPLQDQPWAHSIAREHSQQMAGAGDIWHDTAGYMGQGHRVLGATVLGENVSMDKTLEANDARLFASPGHHQNIVDPRFNYVGIGIALDANGWVYVTQDFSDIPHGVVAQSVKPAAAPAPVQPASAPAASSPVPAPAPVPPKPPAPTLSPQAAAPPAPVPPAPAVAAPVLAAPAPGRVPTAAAPPDSFAASPPDAAFPFANLIQGVKVPAPVGAPPAQEAAAPVGIAPAAQALPTAAPLDDAISSRSAALGPPQPLPGWVSHAPAWARWLLPAAAVALYAGVLLFGRGIPGPAGPPPRGVPAVGGSGSSPLEFPGPSSKPCVSELPRGPPVRPESEVASHDELHGSKRQRKRPKHQHHRHRKKHGQHRSSAELQVPEHQERSEGQGRSRA
ncbi:MAG TPA: CAP domain-containing protein, partial [Actinomycetota bacterium]|nr:CAP domain-containing protein [Actinomycetota bacterium]